jgi:DNA-binding NarL/FixJ family response regulator
MKVFIADDSLILCDRLQAMLADYSWVEVAGQAQNAHDAIESIHKLKPDLVILDIRMPGGSGIDVLQRIKKELPRIKVIVFTNYPYSQYRKRCMELGADFFFAKSTSFEEVVNAINELNCRKDGKRFAEYG